jgi:methyl-accepting chemotaxis protein
VVELINGLGQQTNRRAINATIEAARAGEAGKGFAVVAGEVKNLAIQTTKATQEVAEQVHAMRAVTESAAGDIQNIAGTIERLSHIASSVAAAVEEQGAATGEIARNVQEAASGTETVSHTITEVTMAAAETGRNAGRVFGASSELAQDGERLRGDVQSFVEQVRAA